MKDKIIFADKDKFSDRLRQPDSTAFYRFDSLTLTQTDKKENKICALFAFLKISYPRTLHPFAFAKPHKTDP